MPHLIFHVDILRLANGSNLRTFGSRKKAEAHERAVQCFKPHG